MRAEKRKEKIVGGGMLSPGSDAICLADHLALGDRVEQFCSSLDKFKCHQHWKIKALRKSCKYSSTAGLQQNSEVQIAQAGRQLVLRNQS